MYNVEITPCSSNSFLSKEQKIKKNKLMLEAEVYSLRAVLEVSSDLKERALRCLKEIEMITKS